MERERERERKKKVFEQLPPNSLFVTCQRWAVHPWHSSMIVDTSQKANAQRDVVSVCQSNANPLHKTHTHTHTHTDSNWFAGAIFVDKLSECWHHAAPPLSKDTSLSTPVLFDPMEIRNRVLYPGNKFVARWQIQRSWDRRLRATVPHE